MGHDTDTHTDRHLDIERFSIGSVHILRKYMGLHKADLYSPFPESPVMQKISTVGPVKDIQCFHLFFKSISYFRYTTLRVSGI